MMADWLDVYLKDRGNGVFSTFKWSDRSPNPHGNGQFDGNETGFWQAAGAFELLNDAYAFTGNPRYRAYLDGYRTRFLDGSFSWSNTWMRNDFVDDILWWSSAFLRTYTLTGDVSYLTLAQEIFDVSYNHGWDTRATCSYTGVPGGLLWRRDLRNNNLTSNFIFNDNGNEKNIATNGNGALIAARLAQAFAARGDVAASARYADIAEKIYEWMYTTLMIDNTTGRLSDNFMPNGTRRDWQFSYNYGLFAAAAYEMWINTGDVRYKEHTRLVLSYGWNSMTLADGLTFRDEGGMDGGDGAGFRIVLMRNTGHIAQDSDFADFMVYLQANAYQAWHNRRTDGLTGSNWAARPFDITRIPSTVAAAGVVAAWYSGFDPSVTYGFEGNLVRLPAWGEGGIYLAEQALRNGIYFGVRSEAPGSRGRTVSVWWDDEPRTPERAYNPDGVRRFIDFIEVAVPETGIYELSFRWFTRGDNVRLVRVNDGTPQPVQFTRSEENVWEYATIEAELMAGQNNIRIWLHRYDGDSADNWMFIDYLKVTPVR